MRVDETTFHLGEQEVQKRLGVFDEIGPWASRVVRPWLTEQQREFYLTLPFLVAAARDAQGRPWATLLTGAPGFVRSPDPGRLVVEAQPARGDGLAGQLVAGRPLGFLGIEWATRRRNRVNGRIVDARPECIELEVAQGFGNCPQYIREREWEFKGSGERDRASHRHESFDSNLRARIESADTFFIATGHPGGGHAPSHGMDASHRGGAPGFVHIEGDRQLVFPDYAGNNHFNTIGNLLVDDRAGLLFVDFETGGMLQLTGRATIDWDSPALADHPGARRLVRFELEQAIDLPGVLPIRWKAGNEAAMRLVVAQKRRESADVVSFHLVRARPDRSPLPDFAPGQHLAIEVEIPGEPAAVQRTYSLSNSPDEADYRISVKREESGTVSRFLHDRLATGTVLRATPPAGDFVLESSPRAVVLLGAGVGVTPMLSMLGTLAATRDPRPIYFLHGARNGDEHAFKREIRARIQAIPNATLRVFYSQPASRDQLGSDFDVPGRLRASHIAELLPDLDADYYICGPVGFMAGLQSSLEEWGVPLERIHSESFGPATIR